MIPSEQVGNSFDADLLGRLLSKGIPAHWIIGTIRYMLARPSIVQIKNKWKAYLAYLAYLKNIFKKTNDIVQFTSVHH